MNPKSFFIVIFFYLTISFVSSNAAIFLNHGGGPYPILEPSFHKEMYDQLKKISSKYPSPRGIVFISGHWEEDDWTMIDIDHPSFYYDYHGFPQQAYNLTYHIKSTLSLRSEVRKSLETHGIRLKSNFRRGYDHGVFIPMMLMYENENAPPVIELSIKKNFNVEEHFNFGKALRDLKKSGFLIVGSGASAHGGFGQASSLKKSQQFSQDLSNIFMNQFNQQKILQEIKKWKNLRHSREMHPRQQHLLSLFVILGVYEGKNKQEQKYVDRFMNLSLRNYILQ